MANLKLISLGLLLLVLAGLVYFRPPLLGGDTSFIMVSGVSMQPTLWEGDLVVVKKTGSTPSATSSPSAAPRAPTSSTGLRAWTARASSASRETTKTR